MANEKALKTILVVDDEPQVLAAIEDTLEGDYRLVLESSPHEAIRRVEKEADVCVILSDQRMPGMNGDEFLARASAISDATRLMITGYADLEAVVRAVNNGHIFGYISKPWDPAALRLAVLKAAEHHRLLRELSEEQRLLHNLMDNIPDAIFFKDREHRFLRLNRAHARQLGVERAEDALGRPTRDFFTPEEALEREREDEQVIRERAPLADKVRRIATPGGGARWSSTSKAPITNEKGEVIGLVGIARDITARQEAEEKIRRLNRVYAVLSGVNSLIVRVRERAELYREACRIAVEAGRFGMAWVGVVDHEAMQIKLVCWDDAKRSGPCVTRSRIALKEERGGTTDIAAQAVMSQRPLVANDAANDPRVWYTEGYAEHGIRSLAALPLMVSGKAAAVLVLHAGEVGFFDEQEQRLLAELAGDISFALDHIEKSERLNHLAYYDALTGLANRALFLEHAGQACDAAWRAGGRIALTVLDIDRFKTVNDTLGRQAGDALLKQVAQRLAKAAPGAGRPARIGADHFALVMSDVESEDKLARRLEQRMKEVFGAPYRVGDTELTMTGKLGIALFPGDGADPEALYHNAEAALKKAKRTGERYLFFRQEMTDRVAGHLRMENRLRRALEREELVLHYQPKFDVASGRIAGMEALIRWHAPEGELVPPAKFIPLMEETGLILEAGAWALRRAALDHQHLLQQGLPAPRIAVNVSVIQLRRRDFVDTVRQALAAAGSPPGIDLEITETMLMEDLQASTAKLSALRDHGLRIALDDFGTGYSSLAYLAKLPLHSLKIDRSFIITMLQDANAMTLVSTIISLSRSLKLKVVAEGVDSEEQARVLRLLRCDEMQGYLLAKPMPLEALKALLSKAPGRRTA